MTKSWTIFIALKTVVKRVPRRFLKDPNLLWIVYQIVKQWKPTRQIWGKEIINSHCPGGRLLWFSNNWFGSVSVMEVIWLPASGTGEMEMQALHWQDQPSKHTRNKVRKILACFPLSGVEDWTTQAARMGHRLNLIKQFKSVQCEQTYFRHYF